MVALDHKTKVLIVGSGLSGVALAQILRKGDVLFEIFERDDGTRSQGWSVGLDKFVIPQIIDVNPLTHMFNQMSG